MRKRGTLTLRREDGRIVAEEVTVASSIPARTIGLIGRRSMPAGKGIVLRPSFSIHTAFMRFPIDVIFLDQDLVVLKIAAGLRPSRTSSCRGAREVVELAAGECERRGLSVGDRVAWASFVPPGPGGATAGTGLQRRHGARVLVASDDARFTKLARFLLEGKGFDAEAVAPDRLAEAVDADDEIAAVVLDANLAVAETLGIANATRTQRPEVPIVVVAEPAAVKRAPAGVRIYDKWDETDDVIAAVERVIAENAPLPEDASGDDDESLEAEVDDSL